MIVRQASEKTETACPLSERDVMARKPRQPTVLLTFTLSAAAGDVTSEMGGQVTNHALVVIAAD